MEKTLVRIYVTFTQNDDKIGSAYFNNSIKHI